MCVCVCVCVFACIFTVCVVSMCKSMYARVFMDCIHVSLQLTVVEMSLFKAVDLYEMTVHLWEGNTPSRTH